MLNRTALATPQRLFLCDEYSHIRGDASDDPFDMFVMLIKSIQSQMPSYLSGNSTRAGFGKAKMMETEIPQT
jgi:hypothetical protein